MYNQMLTGLMPNGMNGLQQPEDPRLMALRQMLLRGRGPMQLQGLGNGVNLTAMPGMGVPPQQRPPVASVPPQPMPQQADQPVYRPVQGQMQGPLNWAGRTIPSRY